MKVTSSTILDVGGMYECYLTPLDDTALRSFGTAVMSSSSCSPPSEPAHANGVPLLAASITWAIA